MQQLEDYRQAQRRHFLLYQSQKLEKAKSSDESVGLGNNASVSLTKKHQERHGRQSKRHRLDRMSMEDVEECLPVSPVSVSGGTPQEKRQKPLLPRIVQRDPRIEWLLGRRREPPDNPNSDEGGSSSSSLGVGVEKPIGECYERRSAAGSDASFAFTVHNDFRLLTWNVDGLDSNFLGSRTRAVIQTIKVTRSDVVFLQEVVDSSFELLGKYLSDEFHIICPEPPRADLEGPSYFCTMLLSKRKFGSGPENIQLKTFWFPGSQMGRHLLMASCRLSGYKRPLYFLTSHLESCRESSEEREKQLKQCYVQMQRAVSDFGAGVVVFGGDLNLRDREAQKVMTQTDKEGLHPCDAWEVLGSAPETRYTWDLQKNDNKVIPSPYPIRMRLDRVYFHTHPGLLDSHENWKPTSLQLIGQWRIATVGRFPSDHFGILIDFASTINAATAPPLATAA